MLTLMDSYSATYSVLIIGLTECLALSWVYGEYNKTEDYVTFCMSRRQIIISTV